jgi:hypothetical protein
VAKRKEKLRQDEQQQSQNSNRRHDDRDKTLEPSDVRPNPLMKSATTANITKSSFGGSALSTNNNNNISNNKERTPFRIERNKNRNQANGDDTTTATSSAKLKRSDILGTSTSTNDYSTYAKLTSHDSGYYDGNYFSSNYKSKYDDLLADVSQNASTSLSSSSSSSTARKSSTNYTGSSTSRQLKPYKRTDSSTNVDRQHRTAINLYDMLESSNNNKNNNGGDDHTKYYRRQYSQRKSTGNNLRQPAVTTFNDLASSSTTDDSSDEFSDFEKTERENRRKEIQNLIKKYAQMDDFYSSKSSLTHKDDINNNNSVWETKAQSPVVIPMKQKQQSQNKPSQFNALGKSQTMANVSHYQSNYDYDSSYYNNSNGGGSYYNRNKGSNIVPITTYAPKSSSKSRMSKALSTFVRILSNVQNEKNIHLVLKIEIWRETRGLIH